jgi:hypothetical protein
VPSELGEHPLTHDRLLGCVMKDVDLPKAEQDFPRNQLAVGCRHATTLDGMSPSCKIRSLVEGRISPPLSGGVIVWPPDGNPVEPFVPAA